MVVLEADHLQTEWPGSRADRVREEEGRGAIAGGKGGRGGVRGGRWAPSWWGWARGARGAGTGPACEEWAGSIASLSSLPRPRPGRRRATASHGEPCCRPAPRRA